VWRGVLRPETRWRRPHEVSRWARLSLLYVRTFAYVWTVLALVAVALDFTRSRAGAFPASLAFVAVGIALITYGRRARVSGVFTSPGGVLVRTWWRDRYLDWNQIDRFEVGILIPPYVPLVIRTRDGDVIQSFFVWIHATGFVHGFRWREGKEIVGRIADRLNRERRERAG
jgi:hypothetical protein